MIQPRFLFQICQFSLSEFILILFATRAQKKTSSFFADKKIILTFAPTLRKTILKRSLGEVAEWSIAAVLKTVVLRGTRGSNPCLSATNAENQQIAKQTPSFAPKNVKSGVFVLFKIIQPLHNKRVAILKESDEKRLIFIYPFTLIFQDFTSS